jgi:hypothetical protein
VASAWQLDETWKEARRNWGESGDDGPVRRDGFWQRSFPSRAPASFQGAATHVTALPRRLPENPLPMS